MRRCQYVVALRFGHGFGNAWITKNGFRCSRSLHGGSGAGGGRGFGDSKTIGSDAVLITTPIFYVNAEPHIGHAYSALLADALSRWYRLKGVEVYMTTGTDEHGSKIEQAASKHGKDTKGFCDEISEKFRDMMDEMGIAYDDFIRTTEERHARTVLALWKRLDANGHIYYGEHNGWYCQSDEEFLSENEVTTLEDGTKLSSQSGRPVEEISEANFVFRLTSFEGELRSWLEGTPVYPKQRCNEVLGWLNQGLRDLSISRPMKRVKWGIPVPGHEGEQSIYVWLDALSNYLTVCGIDADKLEDGNLEITWPQAIHVVGKDILRFHAIYWPAFLIGAGIRPPSKVIAHGHWTVEGSKMSKSTGNVVSPSKVIAEHGKEPLRYFLLRSGGLLSDGDFSLSALATHYNTDLANVAGNLISRSLAIRTKSSNNWPNAGTESHGEVKGRSEKLRHDLDELCEEVDALYSNLEFAKGVELITRTLRETNTYFSNTKPWELQKEIEENPNNLVAKQNLETIMSDTLHSVRICSILLQPIVPDIAKLFLDVIGVPSNHRTAHHARLDSLVEKSHAYSIQHVQGKKLILVNKIPMS